MQRLIHLTRLVYRLFPFWAWTLAGFLGLHLPALLLLPVFADEAIYIHWAQLILDDAQRFAFFSMADGKPPLFMWLLSMMLRMIPDPLFAGRFLALLIGLATVTVMAKLTRLLSKRSTTAILTVVFISVLPFWFFYHRVALMDGLLVLCLALSFLTTIQISVITLRAKKTPYKVIPHILLLALFYGAALYTKTPALFAIPSLALSPLLAWAVEEDNEQRRHSVKKILVSMLYVGFGGFLGGCLFLFLRVSSFFGALFSRSQDFTFTFSELLMREFRYVILESLPRVVGWLASYLTLPVLLIPLLGLFYSRKRKTIGILIIQAMLFAIPLIGFGRVLWPRYFLPVALFYTLASVLSFETILAHTRMRLFGIAMIALTLLSSAVFIFPALLDPAQIPFVAADRTQYLTEWSAGYGNLEIATFIKERHALLPTNSSKKIVVLTEGSFGTLPDGLTMYFQGDNALPGIEIEGIGVSVSALPQEFLSRANQDEIYYAVNSHRLGLVNQDNLQLIFEFKRPSPGPSLLFYQVH